MFYKMKGFSGSVIHWYFSLWIAVINAAANIFLNTVLRFFYKFLYIVGQIIIPLAFKVRSKKEPLKPIKEDSILRQSVCEIAQNVRTRKITSEKVLMAYLERIEEVNSKLTSVVDNRFETAMEEARRTDRLIQSGEFDEGELREKFPLLGIPFTIKDSFAVEGLRHTAGLVYRRDIHAEKDADAVKILKKAGAIPIAVTNVSELCMWWESVNKVYGRSKNPYDTRHTTGGSSGGEASLQGSAGSAFGIGSDIGGSVRMPAFFCGCFGHKPSTGLISNEGQVPLAGGRLSEFLTPGPITRHAEDLRLIFDTLVGSEIKRINKCPELRRIRVYYMEDDGGSPLSTPVSKEIRGAMKKALDHLEKKYGLKPQRVNIARLFYSLEIWAQAMTGGGHNMTFCEELVNRQGKINPFTEIIRFFMGRSVHTLPALFLGMIEKLANAGKNFPRHKEMIEMGRALTQDLQDLLRDDGILLYPSHPGPAPRHHEPFFRPADFSYTAIFNVSGVPVTQVPLGLGKKGLPLGFQIIGGMYSDHLTISVAQEFQEAFGGWVAPSDDLMKKQLKSY